MINELIYISRKESYFDVKIIKSKQKIFLYLFKSH